MEIMRFGKRINLCIPSFAEESNLDTDASSFRRSLQTDEAIDRLVALLEKDKRFLELYTGEALSWSLLRPLKVLVAHGINLKEYFEHYPDCINQPIEFNDLQVLSYLIDQGYQVKGYEMYPRTPLNIAIVCGKLEVVKLLVIRGSDVNQVDAYESSPIGLSVGNVRIRDFLVSKGAKARATELLHCIFRDFDEHEIDKIRFLIKNGADINSASIGTTLLHRCICLGSISGTKKLIELGADMNVTNKDGKSALHTAASSGVNDGTLFSLLEYA